MQTKEDNVKRTIIGPLVSAGLALSSAPALAADDLRVQTGLERRSGAFVGGSFRIDLGPRATACRSARIGLGMIHSFSDSTGAVRNRLSGSAVELGLSRGRPELFFGGRSLSEAERRLGVRGSSTTPVLIAGAVAVGVGAFLILSRGSDDGPANPCPPGVEVCATQ
ncbi:hypothetical protein [Allosphingosinicella sp.]|uniref:hypothetical protein n=1 Tax=Allosphingosinicella sp. TaxID=2823234 RepID=UPI002EE03221